MLQETRNGSRQFQGFRQGNGGIHYELPGEYQGQVNFYGFFHRYILFYRPSPFLTHDCI